MSRMHRINRGRTPLFVAVRRALRAALVAQRRRIGGEEWVQRRAELPRREFLKQSLATAAWLGAGAPLLAACGRGAPRIVIVGAGIAGLNAAHTLKKAGVAATVYEASERIGGRIRTARDVVGPGIWSDLGGEFIDSTHADVLDLAREFGLELLDRAAPDLAKLKTAYFFGGRHYTEAQVIEAFKPLAARIARDAESLGDEFDYRGANDAARALDNTALSAYLENIGADGWLRDLLEVAYVTEFGLDAEQQSALNLIDLIDTDVDSGEFRVFGDSDERYVIRGGSEQLVQALARRLDGQVELQHRLEAIHATGGGYTLVFHAANGAAKEVRADLVILALPFSLLREVSIEVPLPDLKRKAIDELGYGTNAKLLAGLRKRVWRAGGYDGELFTDEPLQLCWDHTLVQPGEGGGITLFLGGRPGMELGHDSPERQLNRLIVGLERAFPGARDARTERVVRFHWPTHPFSKGSYACYKVGQWTSIGGAEGETVGKLFFAGEHCSSDFQGYMNGGAESGRVAAHAVLAMLKS